MQKFVCDEFYKRKGLHVLWVTVTPTATETQAKVVQILMNTAVRQEIAAK